MVRLKKSAFHQFGNLLSIGLALGAFVAAGTVYYRWQYREQRYDRLIEEMATTHAVDKYLIKAVIRRESEFDPTVRGRVGEIGLMQVTEGAGLDWARANRRKDFSKEMLWNERANIEIGTWYLARALRRWRERDDPVPFALAEYNAGYGHCLRWLPNGPATTADEFRAAITFPMVRRYIATVVEHSEYYRANGDL